MNINIQIYMLFLINNASNILFYYNYLICLYNYINVLKYKYYIYYFNIKNDWYHEF